MTPSKNINDLRNSITPDRLAGVVNISSEQAIAAAIRITNLSSK